MAVEPVVVHLPLHVHKDLLQVEKEIILQQLLLKEMMVQIKLYLPMLTNQEQLAVVVWAVLDKQILDQIDHTAEMAAVV